MNLNELIQTENIEQDLKYLRQGVETVAHPKLDCTVDSGVDPVDQLTDISGRVYFYGQILGEIVTAVGTAKAALKHRTATVHLKQLDDTPKIRVSDLEGFINKDAEVVALRDKIATLDGADTKISLILTALKLKLEALIEMSRRKKQEVNAINKLVS